MSSTYIPTKISASPSIKIPLNKQGELGELESPIDLRCELNFSNHNLGARRRPYKERIRRQYVPGLERGQPTGGLT